MPESWKIAGSYFEACNCDVACPCVFLSPPTSGDCTVLLAWHIDQGRFGQVDLDGFNAVLAAHSPGHMLETKWKVALYVDQRANQSQQDALTQIFSGQAGGHLAGLAPLIGEVLGVKAAPIEYRSEGKRRSLRLGDVAEAEIEGMPGQDGGDVTISSHPFAAVPAFPAVVAKSKQMRFSDYGLKWEVSNKNGFFSPFAYQSAGPCMSVSPILAQVLKRDRAIVAFGLAGVVTLSWTYLIYMDWGMRHMDAGMQMVIMPTMQHWTAWDLLLVFLMWAVMMVPAASPVVLLFAEINRRRNDQQGTFAATGQFLLGYLTAWTCFSVLATLAQWGLLTAALVSPMMESTSKALGAGLLLIAGLFQFSRLKYACLAHCRSPMGFLATEWRSGSWGAFRMGFKHGGYCLGCCWALMCLLFAFGVMNLLWVAGISAFVLLEKITPANRLTSRLSGLLFIGWAAWIAFGSQS